MIKTVKMTLMVIFAIIRGHIMWIKTFFSDFTSLLKSGVRLIITDIALILAARIVLNSSDNAVANDRKPPFIASAVSYISYATLWISFALMLIIAVIKLKNEMYSFSNEKSKDNPISVFGKITSACISVFLFCLIGYLLFVLGYTVLSIGGNYFDLIFHGLIPPLGYSCTDYGTPMILYTVLAVSVILFSIILALAFSFTASSQKKQRDRYATGYMLGMYAISLTTFIILILSNIPPAELFAGYMYSGSYSNVISAYLAAMIAIFIPAIISFPFTIFLAAKHRQ